MLAVRLVMGAGVDRGKMKHSHVGLWGQKTDPWPWVFLGSVYVNSQDTLGANPIGLTISCCPSEGQRVPLSLPFWAWFQLSSVFFFPIKKKFSLIFSFSTPYVVFSTSWIPITYYNVFLWFILLLHGKAETVISKKPSLKKHFSITYQLVLFVIMSNLAGLICNISWWVTSF